MNKKRKQDKTLAEKAQPRPPEIMRKGGAMRDRSKYTRKQKHKQEG